MAEGGASGDEPPSKKGRRSCDVERLLNVVKSSGIDKQILNVLKTLQEEKKYALCALTIDQCNAAVGYGVPFSRAWCHTDFHFEEFYSFQLFFENGFRHLRKLLTDSGCMPDENDRECIVKLLTFFADKEAKKFIEKLESKADLVDNETRLSVVLAEHLFKKLALKSCYTLDHHCQKNVNDKECKCGCHTPVSDKFGNTSIGHHSVWHGNISILVGKDDLPVVIEGPDPDSPGGKTPVEVYSNALESVPSRHQMLAQSIVFSFLQKKRHPDSKNFLIPCVGVSIQQVIFYFYDSKNDVLLQSAAMPFVSAGEINYIAIVALWLVLNYKHFCSGLPKEIKVPKANFVEMVKEEIDIYNDRLSIGDVWGRGFSMVFDPTAHPGSKFRYNEVDK